MSNSDHDHELKFWINYRFENGNFLHRNFYEKFFPFQEIKGKILEIGCGGAPFYTYIPGNFDKQKISLIDPLLNDLSTIDRYNHLTDCNLFSCNFLEFNSQEKYDTVICLNVIDHFPYGQDEFLRKVNNCMFNNGQLYLYYDLRTTNENDHYAINESLVRNSIHDLFEIVKEDYTINPNHVGWSKIYKSHRAILNKKPQRN